MTAAASGEVHRESLLAFAAAHVSFECGRACFAQSGSAGRAGHRLDDVSRTIDSCGLSRSGEAQFTGNFHSATEAEFRENAGDVRLNCAWRQVHGCGDLHRGLAFCDLSRHRALSGSQGLPPR